jgi:hypothetical protein
MQKNVKENQISDKIQIYSCPNTIWTRTQQAILEKFREGVSFILNLMSIDWGSYPPGF